MDTHRRPSRESPGCSCSATRSCCGLLVEGAGFTNVRMEDVPVHNEYPSVEEYVRRSNEMGGMFTRAWANATAADQELMQAELREAFAPFAVDSGYRAAG